MNSKVVWKHKLPGIFSGGLQFSAERVVLKVGIDRGQRLLAYGHDGQQTWTHDYEPAPSLYFPFGDKLYIGGTRVVAIDAASGRVVAARAFQDEMTIQVPCELGPVFCRGALIEATAIVGLDPDSLEPNWEWPDVNYCVRRRWLCRSGTEESPCRFVRVPDLLEVELRPGMLPTDAPGGRDTIFSSTLGLWCAFGQRAAAAVTLPDGAAAWRREEPTAGHHRILWSTQESAYGGVQDLSAYDLSSGRLTWRHKYPGPIDPPTSATPATGFITTQQRTLHRVDLRTGETTGQFEAPKEIVGLAAIDESRIAIATHTVLMCVAFE